MYVCVYVYWGGGWFSLVVFELKFTLYAAVNEYIVGLQSVQKEAKVFGFSFSKQLLKIILTCFYVHDLLLLTTILTDNCIYNQFICFSLSSLFLLPIVIPRI